ncbi:SCP-2 sterol transfer family protein [Dongia mobilis]|uniref:SCP-2 sterol transfer family protein n=1 Tax=Dongia mobilis TaxID=578943 RepID=A0A4R6WK02_9PROT|nr:SCP2 sterol-binding domain-containing protein [Dongia mobilis]TDQ80863.1 SCP-2 sterol transfer family protein [Dongia mobilis]
METDALIEEMRRRAGQNVKLGYKVKFLVEDDIIFWDGTEHPPVIEGKDLGDANTTITINPANLQKLLQGQLDPTLAYMTGKLKVEGSMGVALKLTAMFSD